MKLRIAVAILIGVVGGAICYGWLAYLTSKPTSRVPNAIQDFTWPHRSAELLRAGQNPYRSSLEPLPYDPESPLFYPLPSVLYALPFTYLPRQIGAGIFFGLSTAVLAFAVTREGWAGLIIFSSCSYWISLILVQWTPLLVAVAFLPASLFPLTLLKPNLGVPVALAHFTLRRAAILGAILLATLLILPTWPLDWLRNLGKNLHTSPVLAVPGFLLLLAALRWREPEGRMLLLIALIPQRLLVYDELLLWAIPKTFRTRLLLSMISWLGLLIWMSSPDRLLMNLPPQWIISWFHLPALAILLFPLLAKRRPEQSAG